MSSRCQHGKGQFWGGNRQTTVNSRDTPRSSVEIQLNRSRCHLGCGLAWADSITCYMGGSDPPWEWAILVDRGVHCKVQALSAASCAKTAKPIHFPFRLWTRVGRRMHKFSRICQVAPMCLMEGHVAIICRITLNHPSMASMWLMANYFHHLLCLEMPTYTVAQITKRFEPSTVLWAFHTIQPSSFIFDFIISFRWSHQRPRKLFFSTPLYYHFTTLLHC